jgi:hypothetical protein
VNSTLTLTVAPGVEARLAPAANVANTAGMARPVASPIMPTRPVRPGWPSFMTITAEAPAAWALRTLTLNPHVPRWTRATDPASMPVKSAASQPLLDVFAGRLGASRRRSARKSDPVASPSGVPESNWLRMKSVPLMYVVGFGEMRSSSEFSSVYTKSNSCTTGV